MFSSLRICCFADWQRVEFKLTNVKPRRSSKVDEYSLALLRQASCLQLGEGGYLWHLLQDIPPVFG
jgi:hypothetical protein